jgi:hypothetical protein
MEHVVAIGDAAIAVVGRSGSHQVHHPPPLQPMVGVRN